MRRKDTVATVTPLPVPTELVVSETVALRGMDAVRALLGWDYTVTTRVCYHVAAATVGAKAALVVDQRHLPTLTPLPPPWWTAVRRRIR